MDQTKKKKIKKIKKIIKWTLLIAIVLPIILVIVANGIINQQSKKLVFGNIESIPENEVGLLLGTSKYVRSGRPNLYFENRITATEKLFKSGKIKKVVISGDNGRVSYNEPQDMKEELMKRGIPEEKIYLDYAGFRTLDSVYRMKEIFGQNKFTVISQKFHNERAIFIAKTLNLDVVGYNAKDVNAYNGFKTKVREKFARVKVFIDLVIKKKPKYLGEKIIIE